MRLLLFCLLAILLVSCATPPAAPAATPAATATVAAPAPVAETGQPGGDYPAPGSTTGSAAGAEGATTDYPAPAASTGEDYPAPAAPANAGPSGPLPTLDSTLSAVKGRLLENGQPVKNAILYLAVLHTNEKGEDISFSYDAASSPRADTNENGEFFFVNIPPGTYGLVYDIVVQSFLLLEPDSDQQVRVTLEAGKEADMGELDYSELPK